MNCAYCGKTLEESEEPGTEYTLEQEEGEPLSFCCESCWEEAKRFLDYSRKFVSPFLVLMMSLIVLLIVGAVVMPKVLVPLSIALIGALLFPFPFSTPETSRQVGLKQSISYARRGGCVLIVVAVILHVAL